MSGTQFKKHSILILINVRWWNATAFYALNIARLLKKNGHNVVVGCKKQFPAFSRAGSYGLKTAGLNFFSYNPLTLLYNFFKMLSLIRREKIQIINSHRSEDHTFAMLARLFVNVKFILTRGDQRKIKRSFFSGWRYQQSDWIVLTCSSIYQQNRDIFFRIQDKVSVIYGSVDEEHFLVRKSRAATAEKYGIDLNKVIVGMAGRFDTVKDQYTFVKAADLIHKQDKNIYFILAGKEEHIKAAVLKRMFRKAGIRNVLILKIVDDIPDLISLFDVAVITSIGSETISRVLLEYLYAGKPVIGTRINVIAEMIQNGINGEIINPGAYQDLAERVLRLVSNRKLLQKYGRNSKQLYQSKYSEDIFYQQYLEVMDKVLSEKNKDENSNIKRKN